MKIAKSWNKTRELNLGFMLRSVWDHILWIYNLWWNDKLDSLKITLTLCSCDHLAFVHIFENHLSAETYMVIEVTKATTEKNTLFL